MRLSYKVLREGRKVKWYQGFVREAPDEAYRYFLPIPVNLMVRLARRLWYSSWGRMMFPPKDRLEEALKDKYWQGYNAGARVRDEHLDALGKKLRGLMPPRKNGGGW